MAIIATSGLIPNVPEPLQVASARLSPADVRALSGAPLELIADPGDGKAIVLTGVLVNWTRAGTAFDSVGASDDLEFRYNAAGGTQILGIETTGFLDGAASGYRWVPAVSPTDTALVQPVGSQRIIVRLGGAITGGSGTLRIRAYYRILRLE